MKPPDLYDTIIGNHADLTIKSRDMDTEAVFGVVNAEYVKSLECIKLTAVARKLSVIPNVMEFKHLTLTKYEIENISVVFDYHDVNNLIKFIIPTPSPEDDCYLEITLL